MTYNEPEQPMTVKERLKLLPPKHLLFINPPNFLHLMAGTRKAAIHKNRTIEIEYIDGTRETGKANQSILDTMDNDLSLFALVSCVQAYRIKSP